MTSTEYDAALSIPSSQKPISANWNGSPRGELQRPILDKTLENTSQLLTIFYLFSAFARDINLEYAFGQWHNYVEREDLNEDSCNMMNSVHLVGVAARSFG